MAETSIGALAVRIGGDASGLISELGKSKTALGKFGDAAKSAAKSAAQITGAVAAAGAAIFAFTKRQAEMLDELAKTSQKVGVSVESLSALKHAASLSGASFETLTNGLRFLNKNMADMRAGTGEARQAFEGMGVQVVDSNGKLKGTEEMLLELADRFAGMQDGAGKTALAMRIFGKSGAELIPFLNEGRAGIEQLRKEAERLGIVFSTQAAKDAEVFNDNMERLTRVVDGLAVKLAGPLIKALGDASQAMLEAQNRSQGFFATLAAGIRSLLTGDDVTKWNREFINAVDELNIAENKLMRARQVIASGAASGISENISVLEKRLADAKANVNRLLNIKEIIAPEEKPKKEGAKKAAPGLAPTTTSKDPGLEEAMRQGEAAEGAFERVLAVAQATRDLNEEERARKKAHLDQMNKIELDAAMQQGEIVEGAAERERAVREALYEQNREQREREKNANADFWNNLAGLMNTGSKKVFEIGKLAALGQAGYKGALAVMDAWEAGMSVGGPWAPVVAAAYAAAAGLNALNLMNNIRSQQFGGGGGAPIAPTQGASGISPVGAGGGATSQQQRGPDTILNLRGDDIFTGRTVARLAERLNEFTRDGGRILVSTS